jgi:tRNA threonylcarbamoyladenosine biosynthesis protein TsaB
VRILALETTELAGSVAALDDDKLLLQLDLDTRLRSARSLTPALDELWRRVGWQATDIQLIAVTVGPGSFTGLRVGVTAAKTLAYVAGADVMGVDTLEAIAIRAPRDVFELSAAVDAQRGQVAAQPFRRGDDGWLVPLADQRLIDTDSWLATLPPGMAIAGPILRKLADRIPPTVPVLAPALWGPTAESVARVALRKYRQGHRDDLWALVPRYSRRAAAEEKLEQRKKAEGGGGQV